MVAYKYMNYPNLGFPAWLEEVIPWRRCARTGVRGCRQGLCGGSEPTTSKSPGPCSARRRSPRQGGRRPSRSPAAGASPAGSATADGRPSCLPAAASSNRHLARLTEVGGDQPLVGEQETGHGRDRGVKHLALVDVGRTEPPPEDLAGRVHQHPGLEAVVLLLLGGADGPGGLAPEPLIPSRPGVLAHRQRKTVEGVPVPGGMEQGILHPRLQPGQVGAAPDEIPLCPEAGKPVPQVGAGIPPDRRVAVQSERLTED